MIENMLMKKRRTVPLRALLDQSVGSPMADRSNCDLCGRCSEACPAQAIKVSEKWAVDLGRCLWCGDCLESCERGVISMTGSCDATSSREGLIRSEDRVEQAGLRLKDEIGRVLGRSLAIREVDAGSCNGCEVEVNALSNPIYDMERFGIKIVASPRHADMLLVTGPVTRNMLPALMKTYRAMPEPRLVAAMGTCAISGGPFGGTYAAGNGVAEALPVDIYIPGCPPHPRTIVLALMEALGRL